VGAIIYFFTTMNFLEVKGLTKQLQQNEVVSNISFELIQFKKLAIAGETGSGKSTLLKMIAGLVQPTSGKVFFEGEKVVGPEDKLLPGHKGIAYLSQYFELRNNYRVEELLEYASQWPDADARDIFDICQISHLLKRRTDQLSGGEKQRIAAARLLVSSPKLLILDEPYSNLDMAHKNTLKQVIDQVAGRLNITCLLTSHDPTDVLSWAEAIMVLQNGTIADTGTPQQMYTTPASEYVAGLFGKYNHLPPALLHQLDSLNTLLLNDLPLIIRPEGMMITTDPAHGVRGKVTEVQYMGSHLLVQVMAHGQHFWVMTNQLHWQLHQDAYLLLKAGVAN